MFIQIKEFFIISIVVTGITANFLDDLVEFTDGWMPIDKSSSDVSYGRVNKHGKESRSSGRIPMGVKSSSCDDGKTNLTVDWNNSPDDYTCKASWIKPDPEIDSHIECVDIPPHYVALHKCMKDVIEYDPPIPLYGTHRPIWPIYGEYKYCPRQRWLHSLEHGAIVMLYHPCADPSEVKHLKKLVKGCLKRYVITPSNLLETERPLALLSWGCRLSMSKVNPDMVQQFIIDHALKGPEEISQDGDFEEGLLKKSRIVSDIEDSKVCPNFNPDDSSSDYGTVNSLF